jgi:hypothetical protein
MLVAIIFRQGLNTMMIILTCCATKTTQYKQYFIPNQTVQLLFVTSYRTKVTQQSPANDYTALAGSNPD